MGKRFNSDEMQKVFEILQESYDVYGPRIYQGTGCFSDNFLKKRRQWCLKFLSRKAGKISVTFRKIKAVCVEKLRRKTIFFFQSVIESPVPIFIISCNGMTDGCKMSTDLMRLSSDQMNL